MARFKVMGMNKGSMEVLASFGNRKEAEAYVRLTQRSSKYGSIKINEEKAAPAASGGPAKAARGIPAADAVSYASRPKSAGGMPYAYLIAIAIAILVGFGFLVDLLNTQLSRL
jgi:hypothetical protein